MRGHFFQSGSVERPARLIIERLEHGGGVATAPAKARTVGDVFMQFDTRTTTAFGLPQKKFGRFPSKVTGSAVQLRVTAGQGDRGVSGEHDAQFVGQRDWHHPCFEIVVTRGLVASEYAKVKVYLGRGDDWHAGP